MKLDLILKSEKDCMLYNESCKLKLLEGRR
jgi:hypothetical protein